MAPIPTNEPLAPFPRLSLLLPGALLPPLPFEPGGEEFCGPAGEVLEELGRAGWMVALGLAMHELAAAGAPREGDALGLTAAFPSKLQA